MAFLKKSVHPFRGVVDPNSSVVVFRSLPLGQIRDFRTLKDFIRALPARDGHGSWDLRWYLPTDQVSPEGNPLFERASSNFSFDIRAGVLDVGCCPPTPAKASRARTAWLLRRLEVGSVDMPFFIKDLYGILTAEAAPAMCASFEFVYRATALLGRPLCAVMLDGVGEDGTAMLRLSLGPAA